MSYKPLPIKNEDDVATSGDPGLQILGIRQDANTSPVSASGDYHPLVFNDLGRLKVAGAAAQFTPISMSISAIQAAANTPVANATAFANVEEASNVMAYVTGTFAAVNATFEGSLDSTNGTDGTWFTVQAVRSNANTVETTTGSLSAAPAYAWELSVNAMAWFRVRATARTSGTQNWLFRLGSYATEPAPAVQTHAISGTVATSLTTTSLSASTSSTGVTMHRQEALTTKTSVKAATNGRLYNFYLFNSGTENAWVHFYNALVANVTVGTTAPLYSVLVPANSGVAHNDFDIPVSFPVGLTIAATTSPLTSGSTAPATGIFVQLGYI